MSLFFVQSTVSATAQATMLLSQEASTLILKGTAPRQSDTAVLNSQKKSKVSNNCKAICNLHF